MSLPPPAAYGTTKLIARAGYPDAVFLSSVDVGVALAAALGALPLGAAVPPHAVIVTSVANSGANGESRISVPPTRWSAPRLRQSLP